MSLGFLMRNDHEDELMSIKEFRACTVAVFDSSVEFVAKCNIAEQQQSLEHQSEEFAPFEDLIARHIANY